MLPRHPGAETDAVPAGAALAAAAAPASFRAQARSARTEKSWRQYLALGALAVLLHGAAVYGYSQIERQPPRPLEQRVEIELIKPVIVPPMMVEPPPPPPPPPPKKVVRKEPPPPPPPVLPEEPAPLVREEPPPAPEPAATEEPVVEETVTPPPPPVAPPAPVEEAVSEPTAYAAYLSNPAPRYPSFAQKQGWEGKVLLRVFVLASGKAGKVEIAESSGRKTLDDAAVAAVKNWTFVPARRGSRTIDGWTTVPIEFRLAK
jgi:protein TonB